MIGAIIGSVVAGVASAAVGSAMAPKPGEQPSYGQQTAAGIAMDMATLPERRRIEALARLGGKTATEVLNAPTSKQVQQVKLRGQWVDATPAALAQLGREVAGPQQAAYKRTITRQIPGSVTRKGYDFTGMGDADIAAGVQQQLAPRMLAIQEKYGTQFIDATKAAQEASDPQGTAARKMLAAEIEKDLNRAPDSRPVADSLDAQMTQMLADGRNVGGDASAMIAQTLASRAGQAPQLTAGAVNETLASGSEGTARMRRRNQNANAYLSSGSTPEDVQYKRQQQALSNASAFLGGRTPQSEFGNVRNAQQGATPQAQAPGLSGANAQAGQQMAGLALGSYQQNLQNLSNQVNPWYAGLSAALQGANVAGAAGWKPLS